MVKAHCMTWRLAVAPEAASVFATAFLILTPAPITSANHTFKSCILSFLRRAYDQYRNPLALTCGRCIARVNSRNLRNASRAVPGENNIEWTIGIASNDTRTIEPLWRSVLPWPVPSTINIAMPRCAVPGHEPEFVLFPLRRSSTVLSRGINSRVDRGQPKTARARQAY